MTRSQWKMTWRLVRRFKGQEHFIFSDETGRAVMSLYLQREFSEDETVLLKHELGALSECPLN